MLLNDLRNWDLKPIRKIMKKLVVCISLLFGSVLYADSTTVLPPGTQAPTFSLPSLGQDRVVLRAFCGDTLVKPAKTGKKQIVIVNFWATYCGPCQKEMPELIRFEEKNRDKVKLIFISIDKEGHSVVSPFVKSKGLETATIALDSYKHTAKRYGVSALPSLFVIDQTGTIRASWVGYDENVSLEDKLSAIVNSIETPVLTSEEVRSKSISPRKRWEAVAAVECGRSVQEVAQEVGATPEEIRAWYDDLKKAAIKLWGSQ